MSKTVEAERLTQALFDILDETFETHHGIYLDKGTSLFDTLEAVHASQASRPVGDGCATLAAQVAHVTFYLEVLERYILGQDPSPVDWGEIWRTINTVTPEEWDTLRSKLKRTYVGILVMLSSIEDWHGENAIGGALAITVHTAYHLGEIRQALCTLR